MVESVKLVVGLNILLTALSFIEDFCVADESHYLGIKNNFKTALNSTNGTRTCHTCTSSKSWSITVFMFPPIKTDSMTTSSHMAHRTFNVYL